MFLTTEEPVFVEQPMLPEGHYNAMPVVEPPVAEAPQPTPGTTCPLPANVPWLHVTERPEAARLPMSRPVTIYPKDSRHGKPSVAPARYVRLDMPLLERRPPQNMPPLLRRPTRLQSSTANICRSLLSPMLAAGAFLMAFWLPWAQVAARRTQVADQHPTEDRQANRLK